MKTIYKYALSTEDTQLIDMPRHAQVLTVQTQRGEPQLWALVDPHAELETRKFYTYGTGHPIDAGNLMDHVGTYQLRDGQFVFHVFAEVPE